MQEYRLCFVAGEGLPGLETAWVDGELSITLYYTADPRPLVLRGQAKADARAEVHIRPYRVELWVNGAIADEEWPYGDSLLSDDLPRLPLPKPAPEDLGTFENAEGWQPEPSVFVGDCMPYAHGGRYHVLYLKDRRHHRSKWGRGAHQWAHISTADFHTWQKHPMAVEIDNPWEASICTGSWIECGGKQYLYYTVRTFDGSPAPLRRSYSTDGEHFTKDSAFSFTLSDRYHQGSARDPKVVKAEDGSYHMFVTTSLMPENLGCLAHLVSSDLEHWQEVEPIYIAPDEGQPECSDYFEKDGWYYLIFSHSHNGEYRYSRKPFTDWQVPDEPIIPCKSVPKMALWNGRILFSGFDKIQNYGGTLTFLEMKQRPDGQLESVK